MKNAAVICLALSLGACATAQPPKSGYLTTYKGMEPKSGQMRAAIRQHVNPAALARVHKVNLQPTVFSAKADIGWMTEKERETILNEVNAQVCFEVSERYEIVPAAEADAFVRTAITRIGRTGRMSSVVSAVGDFFIPGPVGVRTSGRGKFTAEAELVDKRKRQLAAVTWARKANTIGTDNPSLSRIGDAMQFAEPFADTVGSTFAPKGIEKRKYESGDDPCANYGPRFRPEGFLTQLVTGLYSPEMSGAKDKSVQEPAPVR